MSPHVMHHRALILLASLLVIRVSVPATAAQPSAASIVGTWQVVEWWVRDGHSGARQHPYGRQPAGYYVFDTSGRVFVHVTRNPAGERLGPGRWRTLPLDDLRQLIDRRLAYFGSYAVDAARGVISEHVESDLARELAGATRDVPYRRDGDRLLLGDGETWQAVLMRAY